MSGSRVLPSGVGTQMLMASASARVREVGRPLERAGLYERAEPLGRDVLDVAVAAVELAHPRRAHVDARHPYASLGEHDGERESHVSHADDGQPRLTRPDPSFKSHARVTVRFGGFVLRGVIGWVHAGEYIGIDGR